MSTGFTCGTFDLFHAGHNIFLREAAQNCERLVVGLQTNPTIDRISKNKPIQTMYERYVQLKNCAWVDEIIPYDTEEDLLNILGTNQIDVRFLDSAYKDKDFTGKTLCKTLGIMLFYIPRNHNFSSSELRKRIENESKSKGGIL
jgi:glycerol-3-phosphate cytidylyltransferase